MEAPLNEEQEPKQEVPEVETEGEQSGGKRRNRNRSRRSRKQNKQNGGKSKKSKKSKSKKTRKLGKALSNWINHVKAFAKSKGITYPEALKNPLCKKSFKKSKK